MAISDKDRETIVALYKQGKTVSDIGRQLGIDRTTVYKYIHRSEEATAIREEMVQNSLDRRQKILDTYAELGSISATARKLGADRHTVKRALAAAESETQLKDPTAGVIPGDAAKQRRFVITSALNDCPVHKGFLKTLQLYCGLHNAQLLVIPVRYRNPSLYMGLEDSQPQWPSELDPYWVTGDVELSSNITIMGSVRIQATAARPLQSLPGISKGKSAVFGHPRIALEMVPTPMKRIPMVYMTTGSISLPSYSETKAGRLGEFHHSIAAAIIETDGEYFWWRHIHSGPDGSFIDFETKYTPEGPEPAPPAKAVVMGDIHVGFENPEVVRAVLKELVPATRPENIILHDILDFFSGSHHHANNRVLQVLKEARGRNSVYEELRRVAIWLSENLPTGAMAHIIRSNHHDHLERWLNNNSAAIDAKNLWLWHHLNAEQMREALALAEKDPEGQNWHITSAFEIAIRALVSEEVNRRIRFHDDREPLEFAGIDFSNHGDRGPNGARGSRGGFAQVQRRTFIAHSHVPGITDGCYQVGMSCRSDLPYMSGYSSHFTCSGITYADGHRTLFPILFGKYRLAEGASA